MSGLDYAILGIIALSAAIGVWRGFVREALSLVIWVAAFWLAYTLTWSVEIHLAGLIADRALRLMATFVLLFLSVHVAGFVLARLLSTLIRSVGLSGVDRVAGGGFGIVRGVIAIAVLVLLIDMTPIREETMWQESYMVTLFKDGLSWIKQHYPLDQMSGGLFSENHHRVVLRG